MGRNLDMRAVTQWFDEITKPARKGVYQRKDYFGGAYSYWNGTWWGFMQLSPSAAFESRAFPSYFQRLPWRGLAEKP